MAKKKMATTFGYVCRSLFASNKSYPRNTECRSGSWSARQFINLRHTGNDISCKFLWVL